MAKIEAGRNWGGVYAYFFRLKLEPNGGCLLGGGNVLAGLLFGGRVYFPVTSPAPGSILSGPPRRRGPPAVGHVLRPRAAQPRRPATAQPAGAGGRRGARRGARAVPPPPGVWAWGWAEAAARQRRGGHNNPGHLKQEPNKEAFLFANLWWFGSTTSPSSGGGFLGQISMSRALMSNASIAGVQRIEMVMDSSGASLN